MPVTNVSAHLDDTKVTLFVEVSLKKPYLLGKTTIIPGPNQLAISDAEIRAQFVHQRCFPVINWPCSAAQRRSIARATRKTSRSSRSCFSAAAIRRFGSSRRRSRTCTARSIAERTSVNPTLIIDQRRHIDIAFVGIDNEGDQG